MASGLQGFRASGRDIVADSLRGFAIILLVFYHCITSVKHVNISFTYDDIVYRFLAAFHMPLFFMISGYVHGLKDRYSDGNKWFYYAGREAVNLYLPCIVLSMIYFSIKSFFFPGDSIMTNTPSAQELISIPYLGLEHYWFLAALLFIKLLHLFFECRVRNEHANTFFWAVLFILINIFRDCLPPFLTRFTYGLYFHTGYIIQRRKFITQQSHPNIIYRAILIITGALCFFASYGTGRAEVFNSSCAAMCISLGLFTVFYAMNIANSFLSVCGIYSMMIYALHSYAFVAFKIASRIAEISFSGASSVVFFLACTAGGVLLPLLAVWLYKNVKCFRWIEYIFYPGKLIRK